MKFHVLLRQTKVLALSLFITTVKLKRSCMSTCTNKILIIPPKLTNMNDDDAEFEEFSNYPTSSHVLTKIPIIQKCLKFALPSETSAICDPKRLLLLSNHVTSSWREAMVSPQFQTIELIWDRIWLELKCSLKLEDGLQEKLARRLAVKNPVFLKYCSYFNRLIYLCCTSDSYLWLLKRLFIWKQKVRANLPEMPNEIAKEVSERERQSRYQTDPDESHQRRSAPNAINPDLLLKRTLSFNDFFVLDETELRNPKIGSTNSFPVLFPFFRDEQAAKLSSSAALKNNNNNTHALQRCCFFARPLCVASAYNQPNTIRFLLTPRNQGGAEVLRFVRDFEMTLGPAQEAARFGSLEALKVLHELDHSYTEHETLDKARTFFDDRGEKFLHCYSCYIPSSSSNNHHHQSAAWEHREVQTVQLPNSPNTGLLPLHFAIANGHFECAEFILKTVMKGNIAFHDMHSLRPATKEAARWCGQFVKRSHDLDLVDVALKVGVEECSSMIVKKLQSFVATALLEPNPRQELNKNVPPRHPAALSTPGFVPAPFKFVPVDTGDEELKKRKRENGAKCLELLLEHGASPDSIDPKNFTDSVAKNIGLIDMLSPQHICCRVANLECLKVLFLKGAVDVNDTAGGNIGLRLLEDLEKQGKGGRALSDSPPTPLQLIAQGIANTLRWHKNKSIEPFLECGRFLLCHGASLALASRKNETPLYRFVRQLSSTSTEIFREERFQPIVKATFEFLLPFCKHNSTPVDGDTVIASIIEREIETSNSALSLVVANRQMAILERIIKFLDFYFSSEEAENQENEESWSIQKSIESNKKKVRFEVKRVITSLCGDANKSNKTPEIETEVKKVEDEMLKMIQDFEDRIGNVKQ